MSDSRTGFQRLNSDDALVCKQDRVTDAGLGMEWFVCLKDGHLLNCGGSVSGYERAVWVAETLNKAKEPT